MRDQADMYIKTTEAIAEFVGKEHDKAMKVLVKELQETVPVEPEEPKADAKENACQMEKYKRELSHC